MVSLVLRFVRDQFDDYRESTIGGTVINSLHTMNDSNEYPSCVPNSNHTVGWRHNNQVRNMVSHGKIVYYSTNSGWYFRDTAGQERYKVCRYEVSFEGTYDVCIYLTPYSHLYVYFPPLYSPLLMNLLLLGSNVLSECELCCSCLRYYPIGTRPFSPSCASSVWHLCSQIGFIR